MHAQAPVSRSGTRRILRRAALAGGIGLVVLGLLNCSNLGYYGQAAMGQMRILMARRDIERLGADPDTPAALAAKLEKVLEIRAFAVAELRLPDHGFRTYVELGPAADGAPRRAVVWNVVAAPELSTVPIVWCFPVAGCVSYRGYFKEKSARRFAARLDRQGYDVAVAGASAYSTLGWFEDPLLSTVIDYPDVDLAGLIFHELAHQVVWARDDTRFNESFATAVELEGVRRWLAATDRDTTDRDTVMERYLSRQQGLAAIAELIERYRDRLQEAYERDASVDARRRDKERLFAELEETYHDELREGWDEALRASYDAWFDQPLNNAHLASIGVYHDLVPAFERLLADVGGELDRFYAAARQLAELEPAEREDRLLGRDRPPPRGGTGNPSRRSGGGGSADFRQSPGELGGRDLGEG